MSEFYTNISMRGKYILYRGIDEDGNRVTRKEQFSPTLFVPSQTETEWKTLEGFYVEPFQPGTIPETRDFINQYKDVKGFDVYGNTDYVCQYIADNYPSEVDYDISKIVVANIDIETESEYGFPEIDTPRERVNAISVDFNGTMYVFGLGEFNLSAQEADYQYKYDNEKDLLREFLEVWERESPDIVTGWNVRFFDIPYLVNRITNLFDESEAKRMSPWKSLKERKVEKWNRENTCYELGGLATLDYYELYKTFTYVNQASYSLNHIAEVELGEKKLDYSEYESMSEFYKNDFQKFMEYNVLDTRLVMKLEDKMKLMELAISLAYAAKVNFNDVFGQVRVWDSIIYHYLNEHNIVIPPKKHSSKDEQYAGAYVKDPITGMHDWVVSFDLNSLYPHLIMQYNISPETKIDGEKDYSITPNSILGGKRVAHDAYSVAANGTSYRKDHQGFLPSLMEKLYKERKMYKKKMIECQKQKQDIPRMNMPTLGKHALDVKLTKDISKYNNFQLVRKIQLNSAYGAIGNQWFRYFDVDMAEAITLSGQLSIRWIANHLNDFMNKTIGTKDYDYVVASDTDSVYLRCGNLVDKVCGGKSKSEVVDFLDKASEEIILPFIKKKYDELACIMNAYDNKMVMDRECIADKAVWTAKKRYMMRVHDSEGIRYTIPKTKIMGIETTRSSTPQVVRDALTEAINLILTSDEQTIIQFIDNFRTQFNGFTPEEIAFPRGVNGMTKYLDRTTIYQKSTPIAVKGSLLYNHDLRELNLTDKYREIVDGDKIKFLHLKKPNPLGGVMGQDQVVAFPNELPKEFGLDDFIDYDTQFEKAFLHPLKNILEIVGWQWEEVSSLEGFFV